MRLLRAKDVAEILIVRAAEPAQRKNAQLLTSLAANLDRLPKPAQIAELPADLTASQVLEPLQLADDPGAVAYVEFVRQSCRAFEE